jgi:hypothetical protein
MKKILVIILAALAFACDAPNQSSERGTDSELEDRAPAEPSDEGTSTQDEPSVHSDTTTSGGMNRQNQYDTIQ